MAQMLGPINDQAAKNKLEITYEGARQQLLNFIEQQRIDPEDLPNYKVQKVIVGCYSMTIITSDGYYVQVFAEPGYEGSVDFCIDGHPDIEDAHNLDILSDEQYNEYKVAQQAWLNRDREVGIQTRLKNLVREAGADTVQDYLNGLNPERENNDCA